jgi:hypothetical protein
MAEEQAPKNPNAQKVWNLAKGIGMVLAMLGGGYGTFGTADEGAVRGALTETLDELDNLRDQIKELRRLRDEDRRQWSQFLMQRGTMHALPPSPLMNMVDEEGAEVVEIAELPAELKPMPKPHVQKARKLLDDL